MLCPRCKSHLSKRTVRTCEVYCCMECDGIWVGKETFGRLGDFLSLDLKSNENKKFGLFKPRDIKKSKEPALIRICPQCDVGMRQFNYAYDSNIFLDKCPKCGGVWADTGEMMRVAEHLKTDIDERIIAGFVAENPYFKQAEEDAEKITKVLDTILCVMRIFG